MILSASHKISRCSSNVSSLRARACLGQSTVEAALLIPGLLVLFALLMQPACVLYTHTIMQGAAAEGARALTTAYGKAADEEAVRKYVLRRLEAVPDLSIFHSGGEQAWEVELKGAEGSQAVSVAIAGHLELLPLTGGVCTAFGLSHGRDLELNVQVEEQVRPSWLEGGYRDWVEVWG